jgi:hypothetical protein
MGYDTDNTGYRYISCPYLEVLNETQLDLHSKHNEGQEREKRGELTLGDICVLYCVLYIV